MGASGLFSFTQRFMAGVVGKSGRRTTYKPEYAEQAYKFCLMGATDAQLADFLGIRESTLNKWKNAQPEFKDALRRGKVVADANVAEALYHRAIGYSHPAVKIFADPKTGAVVRENYTEHYPPDVTACNSWLNNRQKLYWLRSHRTELTGADGTALIPAREYDGLTDEQLVALAAQLAAKGGEE